MGMGIVSNDDFEKELHINGVKDNIAPAIEIVPSEHGRNKGDVNVPDSLRKIIGEESATNGRGSAIALARTFGISDSSVSAYAKGATSTSTYHRPNKGISEYIKSRKNRLTKKALHKLAGALDSITEEDFNELKPKDKASIAKDMSAIVKNLEPAKDNQVENQQNNQFIFYAPQFMNEEKYDVVQVNE